MQTGCNREMHDNPAHVSWFHNLNYVCIFHCFHIRFSLTSDSDSDSEILVRDFCLFVLNEIWCINPVLLLSLWQLSLVYDVYVLFWILIISLYQFSVFIWEKWKPISYFKQQMTGLSMASCQIKILYLNERCFFFSISRDQLNSHLDNVQGDLEALKDFLRESGDYQVDANTLLGVSIYKMHFRFYCC